MDEKSNPNQESTTGVLDFIDDEHVLIIGGTGSLGTHLVSRMLTRKGIRISIVSRDENKQWHMKRMFPTVGFHLGDMRNYERIRDLLQIVQPNIIILAGALKHIDQCEAQPEECIATNISGVSNVIRACFDFSQQSSAAHLKAVLFISTDKACSPVNVYGMSKAISERLVTQMAFKYSDCSKNLPKFLCVRYGNVLSSRGSIVPRYIELAADPKAEFLPVTDKLMTRFFLTLDQSIDLIFHAIAFGKSGETWIPIVPSIRILDLAEYFAKLSGKNIRVIGIRPGEKRDECLINETESSRTEKRVIAATGNQPFYVIAPCLATASDAIAKSQNAPQTKHDFKREFTSEQVSEFQVLKPAIDKIIEQSKAKTL